MKQLAILLSIAFLFTSCDSILSPESSTTNKSEQLSSQLMQSSQQSGQGHWERQESGTDKDLKAVHFADAQNGWAVGNKGTIVHTSDGGQTWQQQESGTTEGIFGIHFTNAQTGWAVGGGGIILHTTNGGQTWQRQESGTSEPIAEVQFIDAQNGWALGDDILHTTDGGQSWRTLSGGGEDFYFADSQNGWKIFGTGTILHTSDGGQTWQRQADREGDVEWLSSVHFTDARTGWVAGWSGGTLTDNEDLRGAILHTSDGGATWTRQQTDSEERRLFSIYFVDRQNGWSVGAGGILHTSDGGQNWQPQKSGTPEALLSVYFTDAQHGWAVGDNGSIVHYSVEQEEPPPPEPSAKTIYEEQLNDPWIDASWNASVNYSSSERARSGSKSIRVEQNAWGALSTRSGQWGDSRNISPGQYKQVTFAVYAPDQPVRLDLRLQNSEGDDFPRVRYGTVEAGSWAAVSVSLAKLNPNDRSWNRLVVSESSGSAKTYFVDELGLTGDGEAPPPENEPEALTVYQDKLKDQWIDASWNATVDYNNSKQTHSGSHSIRVEQDPWGALSTRSGQWGNPKNIDPDQYKRVTFAVYASEQPATVDLILENDQGHEFPRVRYGRVEAGSWTTVSVPLDELNPDGHPFNRIDIAESSGAARTYFVDELKLEGRSGSGQMAAN